jgi:hypothetical protein
MRGNTQSPDWEYGVLRFQRNMNSANNGCNGTGPFEVLLFGQPTRPHVHVRRTWMLKCISTVTTLLAIASLTAVASDREDDVNRTQKAAQVFKEIMNTPDQGIPSGLLESAKCIAIIPGDKNFAFIFGGNYGRGLATCRAEHGWSAPMFVAIDGGAEIISYKPTSDPNQFPVCP